MVPGPIRSVPLQIWWTPPSTYGFGAAQAIAGMTIPFEGNHPGVPASVTATLPRNRKAHVEETARIGLAPL
jgi:hypothetical protein